MAVSDITKARNEGAAAGASQAEIEKRIAKIREDMTDKARQPRTGKSQQVKDAEELARILDRINGNASGLGASYYTDLQKLFAAYGGGKLTLDQYRDAVEKLTVGQKFYKDTLDAQAKAQKEAEKAQSDYFNHWQKYLGSLDEEAQKLEEQNQLWGLGKQALADMALIRAEDTLAKARDNGVSDEYIAKLEQEVELRRRIASATGSIEAKEANKKAADDAAREWLRVSEDISRGLTDAIFRGGKDGWELFVDTVKATVIRAYVQPVIQGGINSALGGLFGTPTAGTGGLGGMGGAGSSLFNLGTLTSYAGMGQGAYNVFADFASSSFGSSLGLSSPMSAGYAAPVYDASGALVSAGSGGSAGGLSASGMSAGGSVATAAMYAGYALTAYNGLKALQNEQYGRAAGTAIGAYFGGPLGAYVGGELGGMLDHTPTYHAGGAYTATTSGQLYQANAGNTPGFNLGWGAYRSDRFAGYDSATAGISAALAKQIVDSTAAYGGSAKKLAVTSRFASDNDDWSEGAIRIVDEAGKRVFDFTKRYTKDSAKALEQFTADSTRALVGALKASGLSGAFDALFASVDPLTASLEDLNTVMQKAATVSQIMGTLTANTLDAAALQGASPAALFRQASDALRDMAQQGALSLDDMLGYAKSYYDTQVSLLGALNTAGRSVGETLQGSVRNLKYGLLDAEGQYNMLDQEAARYMDVLRGLTDPQQITDYVGKLNETLNAAWNIVPTGVKEAEAQAFIDRFGQVEQLAQSRIESARQQALDDQQAMANTISSAIISAFGGVAPAIEEAAKTIPRTISVTVQAASGTVARTEIGY